MPVDHWLRTGSWKNHVILANRVAIWLFYRISAPGASWHQRAPTHKACLSPPSLLQERGQGGKARLKWIPHGIWGQTSSSAPKVPSPTHVQLPSRTSVQHGHAMGCPHWLLGELRWYTRVYLRWGSPGVGGSAPVVPWCHLCPWHSVLGCWLRKLPEVSRNCHNAGLGTQIIVLSSPSAFAFTPAFQKDISAQYGNALFCDQKKER